MAVFICSKLGATVSMLCVNQNGISQSDQTTQTLVSRCTKNTSGADKKPTTVAIYTIQNTLGVGRNKSAA